MSSNNLFRVSISIMSIMLLNIFLISPVLAGSLSTVSDNMSRLKASTGSDHTIRYTTPTGVAAGGTMTVTFPAGFTMTSIVFGDVDLSWGATTGYENNDTAAQALATTASGATWGASVTGQVLTITSASSTIPSGSKVIIEIGTNATYGGTGTHQIVNNATPAAYTVSVGGTFGDTGSFVIVIVTDEQVAVTGSIDPSLTFTLSANSTTFGTLTTGAVATATPSITLTVGTNANSGYTISVKDQGTGAVAGLYNAGTSTNIASGTANLSAGTEGYGIQASSATATISSPYNVSSNNVGALSVNSTPLATYSTVTASNHTISVAHLAAISLTTKPGAYTDTLTYYVTANF